MKMLFVILFILIAGPSKEAHAELICEYPIGSIPDTATNTCICDEPAGYLLNQSNNTCEFQYNFPSELAVKIDPINSKQVLTTGLIRTANGYTRLIDPDSGKESDWTIDVKKSGELCNTGNEIDFDGYMVASADYYINSSKTCQEDDLDNGYNREDYRSVSISDPLYNLLWVDFGLVPDPKGSTETIRCDFGKTCTVNVNKTEKTESLINLNPIDGTSPILAGNTTAFLYNYSQLEFSNYQGIIGLGGKADLPKIYPNSQAKYCYIKHDATTEPDLVNSVYAKNPQIEFLKINWSPFNEGPSANSGTTNAGTNGGTSVIRGLDSSMRYWLGRDNVLSN